jgi:hypothetical protein
VTELGGARPFGQLATFSGEYTRKAGAGRTYEYAASWRLTGHEVVWSATVWIVGEPPKGFAHGNISLTPGDSVESLVRSQLEAAIERLVGIKE